MSDFQPNPGPVPGERPRSNAEGVRVLNPRHRVPVSLIIDDSTCLVNMAHFGIPQFHQTYPDRYLQPWKTLPREIPDTFVRQFGEWCREHGIKGKYSIVPYPACVGWIDRFLPGWSKEELDASLELVRTLMVPDWDIHPEMISHTRAIDLKTGRPCEESGPRYMENSWGEGRSLDEFTAYIAYALQILKNVGLPCEGITTPGGFGNAALAELAEGTLQACRSIYGTQVPHYFRHVFTDERSVAPRVEYARGLDGPNPECVVSIIGCTGDWFGGWDGLSPGSPDRFITEDLKGGRLPEVIAREEPAILVCHWPGIYFNGQEIGFSIFKEVVRRLHARYDHLCWMKLSEIARYWAARELTTIHRDAHGVVLHAPFECPGFTLGVRALHGAAPMVSTANHAIELRQVSSPRHLESGTWTRHDGETILCFDLPRGLTTLSVGSTPTGRTPRYPS
ncbi:MAG: hypothetical protein QHJ73_03630 [Armatimonadota bacterium]|nr:hypothetical protein [Armatimonadota bacterium]